MFAFINIILIPSDSTSLRVFNVGGNPIGNDGISIITDGLRYNTILTTLRLYECELSVRGKCQL